MTDGRKMSAPPQEVNPSGQCGAQRSRSALRVARVRSQGQIPWTPAFTRFMRHFRLIGLVNGPGARTPPRRAVHPAASCPRCSPALIPKLGRHQFHPDSHVGSGLDSSCWCPGASLPKYLASPPRANVRGRGLLGLLELRVLVSKRIKAVRLTWSSGYLRVLSQEKDCENSTRKDAP